MPQIADRLQQHQKEQKQEQDFRQLLDQTLERCSAIFLSDENVTQEKRSHYVEADQWMAILDSEYFPFPDARRAILGNGSYGVAYNVKNKKRPQEPIRVCKMIRKKRVSRTLLQVQHVCVELLVLKMVKHQNLNSSVNFFHSSDCIFIILEKCNAPRPSVETRLAHIFCYRAPDRLPEVDQIIERWSKEARSQHGIDAAQDPEAFSDFVDAHKAEEIAQLAVSCGANLKYDSPELPTACDLFHLVVAYKRLPDPLAQVIMAQVLHGLKALHDHACVHRDIKVENAVVGIHRTSILHRNESNAIIGATFFEKIETKIIDFGLCKILDDPSRRNTSSVSGGGGAGDSEENISNHMNNNNNNNKNSATSAAAATVVEGGNKNNSGNPSNSPNTSSPIEMRTPEFPSTADGGLDGENVQPDNTTTTNQQQQNQQGGGGGGGEGDYKNKQPSEDLHFIEANIENMIRPNRDPNQNDGPAFNVTSTPVGTIEVLAKEAIVAIRNSGGTEKYSTNNVALALLDVFGSGTILYILSNGRQPFSPPKLPEGETETRGQRMSRIEKLIEGKREFFGASLQSQALTLKLLENDVEKRPTVDQALQDPFVNHGCDIVQTSVWLDGKPALMQLRKSVLDKEALEREEAAEKMKKKPEQEQQQQQQQSKIQDSSSSSSSRPSSTEATLGGSSTEKIRLSFKCPNEFSSSQEGENLFSVAEEDLLAAATAAATVAAKELNNNKNNDNNNENNNQRDQEEQNDDDEDFQGESDTSASYSTSDSDSESGKEEENNKNVEEVGEAKQQLQLQIQREKQQEQQQQQQQKQQQPLQDEDEQLAELEVKPVTESHLAQVEGPTASLPPSSQRQSSSTKMNLFVKPVPSPPSVSSGSSSLSSMQKLPTPNSSSPSSSSSSTSTSSSALKPNSSFSSSATSRAASKWPCDLCGRKNDFNLECCPCTTTTTTTTSSKEEEEQFDSSNNNNIAFDVKEKNRERRRQKREKSAEKRREREGRQVNNEGEDNSRKNKKKKNKRSGDNAQHHHHHHRHNRKRSASASERFNCFAPKDILCANMAVCHGKLVDSCDDDEYEENNNNQTSSSVAAATAAGGGGGGGLGRRTRMTCRIQASHLLRSTSSPAVSPSSSHSSSKTSKSLLFDHVCFSHYMRKKEDHGDEAGKPKRFSLSSKRSTSSGNKNTSSKHPSSDEKRDN